MGAREKYFDGSWIPGSPSWKLSFLHTYPLVMFLGILMAFLTIAYFWKRQKYSWENLQVLIIIIIPSSIFGARFYTLIFDGGWAQWYTLAGLSIYGGVLGGVISGSIYLFIRRKTLDFRTVIGIILPAVLLGQAIGRWGNFDNHEVYGKIVSGNSLSWLTFIKPHMFIEHAYRAPIFLYESILSFFGYFIIVWVFLDRGLVKPGVTAGFYLIYYGIVRLILQTQRDASPMNTSFIGNSNISLNLVVSALVIILGVFLSIIWQFNFSYSIHIKTKKIVFWRKKEYNLITPKKEVRRFFIGKKYERTFRIYVLKNKADSWSKREINANKKQTDKRK